MAEGGRSPLRRETPWPATGAFSSNLDVGAGPISQKWFAGGRTNVCYNCLDVHVAAGRGDTPALLWEGNDPGTQEAMTYAQLLEAVCQLANYLASVGVGVGDAVVAYLPMRLQLPIFMLACARLGAVHSVVFGGFSADALAQRIIDCRPKAVVTATAVRRGAKPIPLKPVVDAALKIAEKAGVSVPVVLVVDNPDAPHVEGDKPRAWVPGRDVWWHDVVPSQPTTCPVAWVDAEHPLFMLYTSGSTGKPKGVVHTTGGYMVFAATTFKYVFDVRRDDVYWCTADCGWITGHTYLAYGPLLCGASQVVFEGVPTYPDGCAVFPLILFIFCSRKTCLVLKYKPDPQGARVADRGQVRGDALLHGTHARALPRAPRRRVRHLLLESLAARAGLRGGGAWRSRLNTSHAHELPLFVPRTETRIFSHPSLPIRSPSTPRRGSGITAWWAARGAPSWTRGGKPRRGAT